MWGAASQIGLKRTTPTSLEITSPTFTGRQRRSWRPGSIPSTVGLFAEFLEDVWIPNDAERYFNRRESAALPHIGQATQKGRWRNWRGFGPAFQSCASASNLPSC